MKKIALVDLKGGLGNQIFIISFSRYLRELGFRVFLDTSFYKSNQQFPRDIELDLSKIDIKNVNFKNNRIFFFLNTWFEEMADLRAVKFKFVNRFTGYYQNLKYLEYNKSFFENIFKKDEIIIKKNKALIHIRRGDYVGLNESLSDDYYLKAIEIILSSNPDITFDLYTDDPSFQPNKKVFKKLDKVVLPKKNEKALDLLRNMLGYQHFIISNSSLSLIAAFFGMNKNSLVIYPDPWWRNFNVKIENIPKTWINLKNN